MDRDIQDNALLVLQAGRNLKISPFLLPLTQLIVTRDKKKYNKINVVETNKKNNDKNNNSNNSSDLLCNRLVSIII